MTHRTAFLPALLVFAAPVLAQAPKLPAPGIMVAPTRLVLDARTRHQEVNLRNSGDGPGTFRIQLVGMDMDEDGACREVPLPPLPGGLAHRNLIQFSPPQVTLKPGESQVIRIRVNRPKDLPDGEYRAHMRVQEVPPPAPPDAPAEEAKGLSIRIVTQFGVAIPLIVRQGETSATVALADLARPAPERLAFTIKRTGSQSVYGDFKVLFHPDGGSTLPVAEVNGVSVWTPNERRRMDIPLTAGQLAGKGTLEVVYSEPASLGGRVIASARLGVPAP
ncbi:MAG TPA: fimbria/pilus periplasmic chaperone [Holophaga sp.]|nr:fimbria/pilus periplasmic chaperone [Holophaga sp.]